MAVELLGYKNFTTPDRTSSFDLYYAGFSYYKYLYYGEHVAIYDDNNDIYYISTDHLKIYKVASGGDTAVEQTVPAGGMGFYDIAINQSNGNVYAVSPSSGYRGVYIQTGGSGSFSLLESFTDQVYGVAVDSSNGDVFVSTSGNEIYKQSGGSGSFSFHVSSNGAYTIAVNSSTHDLYQAVYNSHIYKQSGGSGSFVQQTSTTATWTGLAIDESTDDVYACTTSGAATLYIQAGSTGDFVNIPGAAIGQEGGTDLAINNKDKVLWALGYSSNKLALWYMPTTSRLLVAIIYKDDDDAMYSSHSMTELTSVAAGTAGALYVFYKFPTTTDIERGYLTFTGDSEEYAGYLFSFSGADSANPMFSAGTGNSGTSSPATALSLSLSDAGYALASFGIDTQTFSTLTTSGWTDFLRKAATGITIAVAGRSFSGAGSTGNVGWTLSPADDWASVIVAVKPAFEPGSQHAYLEGIEVADTSISAYVSGVNLSSDSQSAYIGPPLVNTKDSSPAYLEGMEAGEVFIRASQHAYIRVWEPASSSTELYIKGQVYISGSKNVFVRGYDPHSRQHVYLYGNSSARDVTWVKKKELDAYIDGSWEPPLVIEYQKSQAVASDTGQYWAVVIHRTLSFVEGMVYGTADDLYISSNFGDTFTAKLLNFYLIYDIIAISRDGSKGIIHAKSIATAEYRTYYSSNYLSTWSIIISDTWLSSGTITKDGSTIIIAEYGSFQVKKSTNGGQSWTDITPSGLGQRVQYITTNDDGSKIVMRKDNGLGLYYSVNGGDDWTYIAVSSFSSHESYTPYVAEINYAKDSDSVYLVLMTGYGEYQFVKTTDWFGTFDLLRDWGDITGSDFSQLDEKIDIDNSGSESAFYDLHGKSWDEFASIQDIAGSLDLKRMNMSTNGKKFLAAEYTDVPIPDTPYYMTDLALYIGTEAIPSFIHGLVMGGRNRGSTKAYTGGVLSTNSQQSAFLNSPIPSDSKVSCYLFGNELVKTSAPLYLEGGGQYLLPDSDISTGDWINESLGATLYPSLADSADSTYVWIDGGIPGESFTVGLALPEKPVVSGPHFLSWKIARKSGTETITLKVELYDGTTLIVSDTKMLYDVAIEYFIELTEQQVALINDYGNLTVKITIEEVS